MRRAAAALIVLVFLAARVPLLFARDPFFDELFTVWMARLPFGSIVPALLFDSGPPLYYFVARLDEVFALRWLSLAFACVPLAVILMWRSLGDARFVAAALLALFPPAALFAVDARAYAMCAAFVALGIFALEHERPWSAAIAFVLAAYCHYYGVLFLPLLLWRRRYVPFVVALLLFAPGFWLALQQPKEATAWMSSAYPVALFVKPDIAVLIFAALLVVLAVRKNRRFAAYVLIPLALAVALGLLGRRVYFPLRFESIIALPLVLWIATGKASRYVTYGLLAVFGIIMTAGILDHTSRPPDPYREAAYFVKGWHGPLVATGYCYLESLVAMPDRKIAAWPREQGRHPGWRSRVQPDVRELPPQAFLWVGECHSAEFRALRNARRFDPLFASARAVVARVHPIR